MCVYKSRLRFEFVCKPRFAFRFVSVQTCLFVCLCIYNQCDTFGSYVHKPNFGFRFLCTNQSYSVTLKCIHQVRIQVSACTNEVQALSYNDQKCLHYVAKPWAFYVTKALTSHIFDSHYQCLQPWLHCLWLLAQLNPCHEVWYIYQYHINMFTHTCCSSNRNNSVCVLVHIQQKSFL